MKHFLWLFLLHAATLSLTAEEPQFIPFTGKYKVLHRWNLRRRINQKYVGLFYGEVRGLGTYSSHFGGKPAFEGEFYWIQESIRDLSENSKPLQGRFQVSSEEKAEPLFPVLQNFPVLPPDAAPGSRWEGNSVYSLGLEGNDRVLIPILVDYQYQKDTLWENRAVAEIRADFALRYKGPVPSSVSAGYRSTLYVDKATWQPLFMRTTIDESISFSKERVMSQQGFMLTWFEEAPAFDRPAEGDKIRMDLNRLGDPDIVVEERGNGLVVTLQNLRFLPDSSQFLPGEEVRLRELAEVLKKVTGRSFLITGHTADVGTAESQRALSLERAEKVVSGLVSQGLSADRFLFEGRGGLEPLGDNATEEGRSKNRRVEILILED